MKYKVEKVEPVGSYWMLNLVPRDMAGSPEYVVLSSLDWTKLNALDIRRISLTIKSDGCSGVPEFYHTGCVLHDFWYRVHQDFDGSPITKAEADARLRRYIQGKSKFGRFSPMAWWRWLAVKLAAKRAWD